MARSALPGTVSSDEQSDGDFLRSAVNGAIGGALATVVMTAYRMPVASSLPPTAKFWARYVAGGEPEDHPIPALVLHLAYGTAAGSMFGVLFRPFRRGSDSDEGREVGGLVVGTLYALALSVFGEQMVLGGLLSTDLDDTESLIFHVGHLVYGLSLGSWIASESTFEDLELN